MEKIKYILLTFMLIICLDVSASTISPFSIKNNNTTGYYDIRKYQSSDMLTIDTYGQIGSSYNVSYVQTLLNFNSNISSSSYYDLKINFTNSNFIASSIQDVKIVGYTTRPTTLTYNENLGTTLDLVYLKNNTSNTNTNSITIRFYNKLLTSYTYFQVFIIQDYRIMNTGISAIDLSRVDDNQAIKDLQENQNTNRDLIINNISSVINDNFNNKCYNFFNINYNYTYDTYNATSSISDNKLIVNSTGAWAWVQMNNVSVNSNKTMTLSFEYYNPDKKSSAVYLYDNNNNSLGYTIFDNENGTKKITFSSTTDIIKIRFSPNNSETSFTNSVVFKNIMLVDGSDTKPYCEYGSTTNKIDDTNNKLDDINSSINNSSVPNKNDLASKLDTTGWLKPGPVDSIINMPLNLINNLLSSLNNNTCSSLLIDIPFLKEKQLTIPCISTLYDKMGLSSLFNSIGAVASAMILFRYLVGFYKWVDDTLSFREQNWGDF